MSQSDLFLVSNTQNIATKKRDPQQFGDQMRGFTGVKCFTIKPIKVNEKIVIHFRLIVDIQPCL
jgi:hypothetical protein